MQNDFNVSVPETGMRIGKSSVQVYRLAQMGALSARLVGGRWWISEASIDAYLKARGTAEVAAVSSERTLIRQSDVDCTLTR